MSVEDDSILNEDDEQEDAIGILWEAIEKHEARERKPQRVLASQPLLTTLFQRVIASMDASEDQTILQDFAAHVLTPLTDVFGMMSAKGGSFARQKQAEYETRGDRKMRNPEDYSRDQTMRAHLLNGLLPAFQIACQLERWGAPTLQDWSETAKRLFIAGYMLHDYNKLETVKAELRDAQIDQWLAPDAASIPKREAIMLRLCIELGLDDFLQPIGGARLYLQDLIYIVHNTQKYSQRAGLPSLLPHKQSTTAVYMLATQVSMLADLLAYVARTPRELARHSSIAEALRALTFSTSVPGMLVARLTYHHVAENRGVLLNFIHEAVRAAITSDTRIPLLFAPSGIVYLERYDAPPLPTPESLIAQIVSDIRQKAGARLLATGKGARRGNVTLQIDDSYQDYFDLPTIIRRSVQIVRQHIRSNKSADRLEKITRNNLPGSDNIPPLPSGKADARLDQIAEWAGFLEIQLRERLGDQFDLAAWLLPRLGIGDLAAEFTALQTHPDASRLGGGIKLWWFWAAAHVLNRQPLDPDQTLDLLARLSDELANALPADLPPSAQVDETKWNDLRDYLARILTIGGAKTGVWAATEETTRYINAKKPRGGGAICAMCGDAYNATKPNETAVAFQPGVYTSRIRIGASSNARSLCSICALEQLLRQLFVNNLDSGRNVEDQRVRYLSLYPSYFFTPETLLLLRHVYYELKDVRLGANDLRKVINDSLVDPALVTAFLKQQDYTPALSASMWTRLAPFMLQQADEQPSKRVLRYSEAVDGTFFMFGLRLFDAKTDIEAWILPAFVAFVLTVALDLKVVVSEGSAAMITESDELPETLWFDGAHPAIRAVLDIGRTSSVDRLHVDEILPTLTRLAVAYLIHLDTEFNGRDERWQRFPPLAHALAESPLYVFHYLIKQEREDSEHKAITRERTLRYLSYALLIADEKGKKAMSIARDLVTAYRGFYRADNFKNSNSILRPINVVADALLNAAVLPAFKEADALFEVAYGELYKFMDRVGKGLADGRFPKGVSAAERDNAMRAFCHLFVDQLFIRDFNRDAAALRGKPVNLLKNACEVIYREMQYAEWGGRDADDDDSTSAE
jgi:CRISPR-associated protein Csc3